MDENKELANLEHPASQEQIFGILGNAKILLGKKAHDSAVTNRRMDREFNLEGVEGHDNSTLLIELGEDSEELKRIDEFLGVNPNSRDNSSQSVAKITFEKEVPAGLHSTSYEIRQVKNGNFEIEKYIDVHTEVDDLKGSEQEKMNDLLRQVKEAAKKINQSRRLGLTNVNSIEADEVTRVLKSLISLYQKEPDWTTNRPGVVEKTTIHHMGFIRREVVRIDRKQESTIDTFPGAKRVFEHEEFIEGNPHDGLEVYLEQRENDAMLMVDVLNGDNSTTIAFIRKGMGIKGAFVQANYKEGVIKNLGLRAEIIEPSHTEIDMDIAMSGEWRGRTSQLLNSMRRVEVEEEGKGKQYRAGLDVLENDLDTIVNEKLGGKSHPMVAEAESISYDVIKAMAEGLEDPKDKEDFWKLSRSNMLKEYIELELMKNALEGQVSSLWEMAESDRDSAISYGVEWLYDDINGSYFDIDQIITINDISDTEFSWEVKESEFRVDMYSLSDEKKTVSKGDGAWGNEITVQDKTFKLQRNNGMITIICSERGKALWHSTIPVALNSKKIADIARDSDADFRKISDLIPAGFQE